ncbi:MAG: phosphate/phosphite/phosphonate ABC transporter substrate-binding protein [Nitrospirae bacterium]|nr:phosphate/phosphite/phosphonate ABC transporter substrate-binding protein [Nitrospirota bacterium]MBF0534568.1 phosphate/phosphite/phosphonate ABC transporter substrate-binding protein [Nitrospirota bacterium]
MTTPVDAVKYYQDVIDYIGQQIKQPVQMVYRRTYSEMDSLLKKGEVEIAFICSAPYVRNKEQFGAELLVAPSVKESSMYHSYIIVHKDSAIKSFPELKGRVFAFTDPQSNSGTLYPTYLLKTMKHTPESFFNRFIYSYSHNKSVEMVAKKIVDGAAVESIIYEYMLKTESPYAKHVKIIKRSPPFGIPPVVVTRGIDPVLRKKVRDAFLSMQHTAKGKAILDAMMLGGFVEVSDSNYDTVRAMEYAVSDRAGVARNDRDNKTVYFGVIPRDNPRIIYEKYQPLLDYLAEKTPYKYELVLKKNYEETVKALGNGETDVALLGPLTYLEAHSKYGAICILKSKGTDGNAGFKSVIIKRKDSLINNPSELKGKSVAFAASKSTSGNLIPRYMLADAGVHLSGLSGYANFDYHDSVVKAILSGQFTAGAVRESVARKYMKLGIKTIAESGSIPTGPLVVGPGTSVKAIESIKKALLELNPRNSDDRKTLNRLDEDLRNGFIEASDKDYEDIRKKINAVPQTCGMGCHPKIRL